MNSDNKILACVDQSPFADSVADHAVWAARRLGASLEFLHMIDRPPGRPAGQDHSGAIGLDAQQALLRQLGDEDEARSRSAREVGREFLNRLRERALAGGADAVDVRQRHGHLEDTLSQQSGMGLYVLGRRGESAGGQERELGRKLEWAVRSVQRPVLVVPEDFRVPSRVLFAFDGAGLARRGVEMIAASPLLKDLPLHLLMVGVGRASDAKNIGDAGETLSAAGFQVSAQVRQGVPGVVIAEAMTQGFDLLVMGAYSHSPWRSLLLGSRTADLLRSVRAPTLLLR